MKVIIVGGVAGGASCAARLCNDAEIVLITDVEVIAQQFDRSARYRDWQLRHSS